MASPSKALLKPVSGDKERNKLSFLPDGLFNTTDGDDEVNPNTLASLQRL